LLPAVFTDGLNRDLAWSRRKKAGCSRIVYHVSMQHFSFAEEIAHAITHGIGLLLSIAALVVLVVFASLRGDAWHIVSARCTERR
jgi:predicted membrane channel-forming protein YqfA (hemolysin III family)